jgi:predicted amidohydrolase
VARTVSIAACNFAIRPVGSFDEFAAHARGLLDQANGADIVLFPELFTVELFTAFSDWKETPTSELTRVDQFTDEYRSLFESEAKERNQYIVAGSHLMKVGERYVNVGHLYEPDGVLHTHIKTHIFPAEADWSTEEGDTIEVIDLPFAKVAFNICYEAEIPECAATATEQGAEIILCPSFTFTEYGFWRVRHCAQARAIENQVYFVH